MSDIVTTINAECRSIDLQITLSSRIERHCVGHKRVVTYHLLQKNSDDHRDSGTYSTSYNPHKHILSSRHVVPCQLKGHIYSEYTPYNTDIFSNEQILGRKYARILMGCLMAHYQWFTILNCFKTD